jgi:non-heme chloroperoxidase
MITPATFALDSGITLSYAEHGDAGGIPLLFLPGPTDSWRSYEPVLSHLRASKRAIAMSPRGHGDSDTPSAGYGIDDLGRDAAALLDGLGIRRAVLVGHSGSCLVARWMAINRPGRVAGLVLEASPTTLRGNAQLESFVATAVADLRDPIDPEFVRSFVVDTSSSLLAPELLDVLVSEARKVPAVVWREMFAALQHYDDAAQLESVRVPTLLIWGDADPVVGRSMQDELRVRIPDAELIVYEGSGHTPRWEDPSRFASDVSAFATRVGHGGGS